ncbi:MAG TPA: hypothetical protein PLY93_15085, partial [Turneriella sp.]|nr:hypothetical protein [Turneriella sp.]
MTIAVHTQPTFWGVAIQINAETKFPSIAIREIYRRLASAEDQFMLESITPDIFPGDNLSEETIDTQFKYLIRLTCAGDKASVKQTLAKILKGASGIAKIGLGLIENKTTESQ